ncbi:MAG: exonuclease domain-containing protein, partial [Thermomicrobiales bacterium]
MPSVSHHVIFSQDPLVDTFVALDLEATGMDPVRHEILEVGIVRFSASDSLDEMQSLVRPSTRVPLSITRLTGINPGQLTQAPRLADIAPQINRFIAQHPVVAHSVDLDMAMLAAAGIEISNERYDTYQLAALLLPDLPNYALATVAGHLGITGGTGHRALDDARITGAVFRGLLHRLRSYDTSTLEQLATFARTADWPVAPLFTRLARETPQGPLFDAGTERRSSPHELAFLVPRERPEPLRANGSIERISIDEVDAALAPNGAVSTAVATYEDRPQQRQMARAVAQAFNDEQHLLVEAGTGTGKSLAYLLPAVLHAAEHGETVVVSTNTLALQDQLYRKDIPDLLQALSRIKPETEVRTTRLKGRNNYLCLRRWFAVQKDPAVEPCEAVFRGKVILWLSETSTGDRAELRLDQSEDQHWRNLSAEEHACVASRCVYQQRNQCFLFRARRDAENAHLVVANHA